MTLLAAACAAQAANDPRLSTRGNDLISSRLVNIPVPAGEFERKAVSFAYALNPQDVVRASTPFTAESREFWMQVDGSELSKGVMLDTTAPGALVRISPSSSTAAIVPSELLSQWTHKLKQLLVNLLVLKFLLE